MQSLIPGLKSIDASTDVTAAGSHGINTAIFRPRYTIHLELLIIEA